MKIFHTGHKGARKPIFHILICLKISWNNDKRKISKIPRKSSEFSCAVCKSLLLTSSPVFHCFPHTFRDTFFAVRCEKNPLRDFLLLLVFANIYSNKFSWQLSITSQNERKESRADTNDEAILADCDPEKLLKLQEMQSSIETNENKFTERRDSCANCAF